MIRALSTAALLCACAAPAAGANTANAADAAGAHATARRDPFARPAASIPAAPAPAAAEDAAPPPPPAPLHLRALILNGARSLASIDGDVVAAGERARDYQVLRIDARGVLVARAGKQELLSMNEKEKQ
ncbi:hypothetical protein [Massilia sp. 9096]|uniref:hypothetical protein n=1 Tax=Massilia sp. 9096 TaxID=1500894 RepID=UPI00055B248F|nr:hypothetical protein [Massilia sp. 9096]